MYLRLEHLGAFGVLLVMLGACSSNSQWSNMGATNAGVVVNNPPAAQTTIAQTPAQATPPPATNGDSGTISNSKLIVMQSHGDAMKVDGQSKVSAKLTQVNSDDSHDALELSGQAKIAGDVSVVGGARLNDGQASISGALHTGVAVMADPMASLPDLSISGMTVRSNHEMHITQNTTLQPGIYKDGFEVTSHATVTLSAGIYVIQSGEVRVDGAAKLKSSGGVLIYFIGCTCRAFEASGQAEVILSGLDSGDYKGVVIATEDLDSKLDIDGQSQVSLTGKVHMPHIDAEISGQSSLKVAGDVVLSLLKVDGASQVSLQ